MVDLRFVVVLFIFSIGSVLSQNPLLNGDHYSEYELLKKRDYKGISVCFGPIYHTNKNLITLQSAASSRNFLLPFCFRADYTVAYDQTASELGFMFCRISSLEGLNSKTNILHTAFSSTLNMFNIMRQKSHFLDIYIGAGFSVGSLFACEEKIQSYNPFFSPSFQINPRIMLGQNLLIHFSGNYSLDISRSEWKRSEAANIDLPNSKASCFLVESGITFLMSNRSDLKRRYHEYAE